MALEYKDYISLGVSLIALAVSGTSLWWGSFRRRIALYFMQTGPWSYALVNGGKTDILVTEVKYWFVGSNPNAATGPMQSSGIDDEHTVLMKAGTASQHHMTLVEPISLLFNDEFARPSAGMSNAKEFTVKIAVAWIDMDGNQSRADITAGLVTLNRVGFLAWMPLTSRQTLAPLSAPGLLARIRSFKWSHR